MLEHSSITDANDLSLHASWSDTAEKESTKLYVGNSSTRSPFLAEELEMINSGKPVLDDAGGLDALGLHEVNDAFTPQFGYRTLEVRLAKGTYERQPMNSTKRMPEIHSPLWQIFIWFLFYRCDGG